MRAHRPDVIDAGGLKRDNVRRGKPLGTGQQRLDPQVAMVQRKYLGPMGFVAVQKIAPAGGVAVKVPSDFSYVNLLYYL
jgi:hypothetical protein